MVVLERVRMVWACDRRETNRHNCGNDDGRKAPRGRLRLKWKNAVRRGMEDGVGHCIERRQ